MRKRKRERGRERERERSLFCSLKNTSSPEWSESDVGDGDKKESYTKKYQIKHPFTLIRLEQGLRIDQIRVWHLEDKFLFQKGCTLSLDGHFSWLIWYELAD